VGGANTSTTYQFSPDLGELTLYAFNLASVRPNAITQAHMESARMAANLLNARWSGQDVNLWAVDLQTIPLVPGNATYSVPSNTIAILDAYTITGTGAGQRNRIILPISRSEYASYPNPLMPGAITVYWFNKLLAPNISFYMNPDGSQGSVSYYRVRQLQDAKLQGGLAPELPYYFLEAYALGLAQRLAMVWNPAAAAGLKTLADEAFEIAANQNTERAAFYVSPMTASYFRP
jgi:hypothetical protein